MTAVVRYVARCAVCKVGTAVDVQDTPVALSEWWAKVNGNVTERAACRICGRRLYPWRRVEGRYSSASPCDSRCTEASGWRCECECGGHNHGTDNVRALAVAV